MPENTNDSIKILSVTSADPPGTAAPGGATATMAPSAGDSAGSTNAPANKSFDLETLVNQGPKAADPQPASGATKSAQPVPAGPSDLQSFFNKQTVKQSDPKLLESLVAQKAAADKTKPILGSSPSLQKALEQEKELKLKRKLRVSQVLFMLVFVAAGGVAAYFYSELSPTFNFFGPNTTSRLSGVNRNLAGKMKEINRDRILAAQVHLNSFSVAADTYLDLTLKLTNPNLSAAEKQALTIESEDAASRMPTLIKDTRDLLNKEMFVRVTPSLADGELTDDVLKTNAMSDVTAALNEKRNALLADTASRETVTPQVRLIDNALKLVGNKDLLGKLTAVDTDAFDKELKDYMVDLDALKRQKLQSEIAAVLSTTSSDIATIGAIKNQRIDWLKLMDEVQTEAEKVDPNFTLADPINMNSPNREGINITGFDFDRASQRISLTGSYRTADSTNFSKISELINTFEESPYFKNIDMRSFVKSGTKKTGFMANFRFDLTLEDLSSDVQKKISLVKKIMAERERIKRSQQ